MDQVTSKRRLALVVGSESKKRAVVAMELIADGCAVVLCPGPPGCPLVRGERCVLRANADFTVIMSGAAQSPEVLAGLALCAEADGPAAVRIPVSSFAARGTPRPPLDA